MGIRPVFQSDPTEYDRDKPLSGGRKRSIVSRFIAQKCRHSCFFSTALRSSFHKVSPSSRLRLSSAYSDAGAAYTCVPLDITIALGADHTHSQSLPHFTEDCLKVSVCESHPDPSFPPHVKLHSIGVTGVPSISEPITLAWLRFIQ